MWCMTAVKPWHVCEENIDLDTKFYFSIDEHEDWKYTARHKQLPHDHGVIAVDLGVQATDDEGDGFNWPFNRIELYDTGLVFIGADQWECEQFWENYSARMGLYAHMRHTRRKPPGRASREGAS